MLSVETTGGVATILLDDGKRNAMNPAWFAGLDAALDEVEGDDEVEAVVLAGRDGAFSAGLDLKLLPTLDADGLVDLIRTFAHTMLRVFQLPLPVVGAATGHALGGGTILSMACDHTVAADGDWRWGLNEVAIGLPLPRWIIAIARANVDDKRLGTLALRGEVIGPSDAVAVGFADRLAAGEQVVALAQQEAAERAQLATAAYAATKRYLREDAARRELDRLDADLAELFGR